jgi:chromosome segregation ATPase
MRWATSFRFTTTVARVYMAGYAQHLFQLQHDTRRIVAEQRCRLVGYAKEVKDLTQEISHKAQENGVVRQ